MNSMLLKLATTQGTSLKVDSGDVSQGVADATKGDRCNAGCSE